MDGIVKAFEDGGFWMWPIFGVSILVLGVSIERLWWLFGYAGINRDKILNVVNESLRNNERERAIKLLNSEKAPLAKVLQAGIMNAHEKKEVVQILMDEKAISEIPKIEAHTGFLVMFSNVATLLGLLGTIVGLIRSFAAVAGSSAGEKATELAQGISEAMNCTAFGLVVAIPALLFYAFLKAREHQLVDDINFATVSVYNTISELKRENITF